MSDAPKSDAPKGRGTIAASESDAPLRVKMLCQSCQRTGLHPLGRSTKPRWCRCRNKTGPIVAAPGTLVKFIFESADAAAFRERCRLISKAEREARDDLSARYVRAGTGYRELPRTSPRRRSLETAYRTALRALRRLQTQCPHSERSLYASERCGVCHARPNTAPMEGR